MIVSDEATICQHPFYKVGSSETEKTLEESATLYVPMLFSWRTETNYTGMIVSDEVCLNHDTCVDDYQFFAATSS